MNIGEAAKASGVSAKMIRHYEAIGLLTAARRSASGYRQYAQRDVQVLQFIHRARQLGFSLERIGTLLSLWNDRTRASREVRAMAQGHIDELDEKIRQLQGMRRTLDALVAACHGDQRPDCPIIDELSAASG